MNASNTVYIVGAGISGLIAALELEKAGYRPVVLEQSDAVGGRVRTLHVNGYDLDIGFQVLLSAYPMAQKYLDMEALKLKKLASGAQILVSGKRYTIGDPLRDLKLLLPTVIAGIGSIQDKLLVLRLNAQLKRTSIEAIFDAPETTTLDFLRNFGFSEKIIDRFFKPFFSGIFLETELKTSSRMFAFVYKMFGEGFATIPAAGIGAIGEQLKAKLAHTTFRYSTKVAQVTNEEIILENGEHLTHDGVLLTGDASGLVSNMKDQRVQWKSCQNFYFEVDHTSIPTDTISLVADKGKHINNAYAFTDAQGREILSVTVLNGNNINIDELLQRVETEAREYFGVRQLKYITTFNIPQALPDLTNIKMSGAPSESQLTERIFLAGDLLFNGSLNAAMESGRLAAQGFIERQSGIFA